MSIIEGRSRKSFIIFAKNIECNIQDIDIIKAFKAWGHGTTQNHRFSHPYRFERTLA